MSYRSIAEEDSYRVRHSLFYISRSFGFFFLSLLVRLSMFRLTFAFPFFRRCI